MQKFHLPARLKQDETQIKSSWFEFAGKALDINLQVSRTNEVVK